jgi:hypothetical protein
VNLLTLADARAFLKPYVDNGTCLNSTIDARVAEIEERLWPKADWRMSHRRVRVLVKNQAFVLPLNVLKICGICVDGTPAALMTEAYEFSSSGPGDLDMATGSLKNAVDQGEHPTQFDIPISRASDTAWSQGYHLIAFSASADDRAASITVRGYGDLNDEIYTTQNGELAPGEVIPIARWAAGREGSVLSIAGQPRSAAKFRSILRVYKPVTKAPVTLYAYDPVTSAMFMLSKMEPETTVPSYRRYRLTGMSQPQVQEDNSILTDCASVLMLVKVGWQRATRATDVLFIQSLSALKMGAMALTAENAGNNAKAQEYFVLAERHLIDQKQDQDTGVTIPVLWDVDINISLRALNHGYSI